MQPTAVSMMAMNNSWVPLARPSKAPNVMRTVADIMSASVELIKKMLRKQTILLKRIDRYKITMKM